MKPANARDVARADVDRSKDDAHEGPCHSRRRRICSQTAFRILEETRCITRFENYLVNVKKWLSPEENRKLVEDVDRELEADRDAAVNSPMPVRGNSRARRILRE